MAVVLVVCGVVSTQAKGETTRITVSGGDLRRPLDIADPALIRQFNVWSGAGVTGPVAEPDGFIVHWPAGITTEPPAHLARYQLAFHVAGPKQPREAIAYVVTYVAGAAPEQGYVYLPGRGEPSYEMNTRSILRGGEGHWFHASVAWARAASRAIAAANTSAR